MLERFRFLAVIAVIGLAVTAAATFGWSVAKSVKFVKVTITDTTNNQPWAIQEVQLFAQ